MNFVSAEQLAQVRPSGTTAVNGFTALLRTEVTLIAVCNTTGSAANMSIYHDDDGAVFDQTTALYYAQSVPANSTTLIKPESVGAGISMKKDGQIGIQTGTGNALTFTLYGVTENIG